MSGNLHASGGTCGGMRGPWSAEVSSRVFVFVVVTTKVK